MHFAVLHQRARRAHVSEACTHMRSSAERDAARCKEALRVLDVGKILLRARYDDLDIAGDQTLAGLDPGGVEEQCRRPVSLVFPQPVERLSETVAARHMQLPG